MTGTTTACCHRALLLSPHRRETAGALAWSAAATRCYRALFPRAHGRKTARPAMIGPPALRSDLAPPPLTHGGETTWAAMQRAPAQRGDFALFFGIHRRKAAPPTARSFMTPPTAWCPKLIFQEIKAVALRGTIARSNFPLPCPCHNNSLPFP